MIYRKELRLESRASLQKAFATQAKNGLAMPAS